MFHISATLIYNIIEHILTCKNYVMIPLDPLIAICWRKKNMSESSQLTATFCSAAVWCPFWEPWAISVGYSYHALCLSAVSDGIDTSQKPRRGARGRRGLSVPIDFLQRRVVSRIFMETLRPSTRSVFF